MAALSEEQTKELYDLCIKCLEFAEGTVPDFALQGDDRMVIALSPVIAALFTQAKYRYRAGPGSTVLVTATMIRNFAMSDELHELGLVDAVQAFMHMMTQAEVPDGTA